MTSLPEQECEAGQTYEGFTVKDVTPLKEIRAVAYLTEHDKSGARILHLHTEDTENLFCVVFPTPPPDDCGLPHILEHSVLAGSRRFPVKEPFFEMAKMSMATFINAMTGYDRTYYPVASNVQQDLFNLADVYFDAVFHPLLTEQTFRREGHHLAPADPSRPEGDITVRGIVYNEMKGAFSDPEARIWRGIMRGLFPDTVYGRESGGDPEAITELTYADFKQFHERFYHPSNGFFCLYGNIPTREYLSFLAPRLDDFTRRDTDVRIERQPRWESPREIEDTYPVGVDEPLDEKTYLALHWLVGDASDPQESLLLKVLTQILLGNEAAPLKKAIIDSRIGHDLIFSGSSDAGFELTFLLGIKGSEAKRSKTFIDLVTATLKTIANEPIERERAEAAFRQVAYRTLEIQQMYPLHTMSRIVDTWVYGKDPLTFLNLNQHLNECRDEYEKDPELFNRIIREKLLDNPHRLTYVLKPDREWQKRSDESFAKKMKAVRATLSEDELQRIAENAAELDRMNSEPNSPEALARLPQLAIKDLPEKPSRIPTETKTLGEGCDLLCNSVFANGVNYLNISFDISGLPEELWPYVPRYCDTVKKMGAAGMDYGQIASRTAACTGGLGCGTSLPGHTSHPGMVMPRLVFSVKTLDEQAGDALDLLRDVVFQADPADRERLRDVVSQARSHYRTQLVQGGTHTASLHAARGLSLKGHLAETLSGLPQLRTVEPLSAQFDSRADDLISRIESIRDFLISGSRFTASFTGSASVEDRVRNELTNWTSEIGPPCSTAELPSFTPFKQPVREGLAGPVQVAYCVHLMPGPHISHSDEPLLALGAHILSFDYALNEIRFKGTAYGAGFSYDPFGEVMSLWSYRDPHVVRTLRAYEAVLDYVHKAEWSREEIDRAVIAVAKREEKPIRPQSATSTALNRYLTGQSDEFRTERFSRLKNVKPAQVKKAVTDALEENFRSGSVCVVAGREKLEAANREFGSASLEIENIIE